MYALHRSVDIRCPHINNLWGNMDPVLGSFGTPEEATLAMIECARQVFSVLSAQTANIRAARYVSRSINENMRTRHIEFETLDGAHNSIIYQVIELEDH